MFFVIVWWFISARHWFKGPVINVEVSYLLVTPNYKPLGFQIISTGSIANSTKTNRDSIICSVVGIELSKAWKEARIVILSRKWDWRKLLHQWLKLSEF